ncbi:MAG: hypothetical protein V2A55_02670 [Candidatus Jorgensenbacteria bacterium]
MDGEAWGPAQAALGPVVEKSDIRSSLSPFFALSEYRVRYPDAIIRALGELYIEYNRAFDPLIEANREWETDYRYCRLPGGSPVNFGVQVDMVGLSSDFLATASEMSVAEVREVLRGMVFEFENSLAMYQLLERIFAWNGEETFFWRQFRTSLAELRQRFGKPIALLAVTDEKYRAMRESEFGKEEGEPLSDAEVFELSGFDRFFGPEDFRKHLEENGGECGCLLYARTSDPVRKLKRPEIEVEHPLLGDSGVRRVIKAHTLTLNVDAPGMEHARRINDTKEYMPSMGMACPIASEEDFYSPEFARHVAEGKSYAEFEDGSRLSFGMRRYLVSCGVSVGEVEAGRVFLRCKPMKGTYGCYGHVSGALSDRDFRSELRRNLKKRGSYVIQVELSLPVVWNETEGRGYNFIDRNFLSLTNGAPRFLGGLRSLMPLDSVEAEKGRNHGSKSTVCAEIEP